MLLISSTRRLECKSTALCEPPVHTELMRRTFLQAVIQVFHIGPLLPISLLKRLTLSELSRRGFSRLTQAGRLFCADYSFDYVLVLTDKFRKNL